MRKLILAGLAVLLGGCSTHPFLDQDRYASAQAPSDIFSMVEEDLGESALKRTATGGYRIIIAPPFEKSRDVLLATFQETCTKLDLSYTKGSTLPASRFTDAETDVSDAADTAIAKALEHTPLGFAESPQLSFCYTSDPYTGVTNVRFALAAGQADAGSEEPQGRWMLVYLHGTSFDDSLAVFRDKALADRALYHAALTNQLDLAETALLAGANPMFVPPSSSWTPLMLALEHEAFPLANTLLEAGALLRAGDSRHPTFGSALSSEAIEFIARNSRTISGEIEGSVNDLFATIDRQAAFAEMRRRGARVCRRIGSVRYVGFVQLADQHWLRVATVGAKDIHSGQRLSYLKTLVWDYLDNWQPCP